MMRGREYLLERRVATFDRTSLMSASSPADYTSVATYLIVDGKGAGGTTCGGSGPRSDDPAGLAVRPRDRFGREAVVSKKGIYFGAFVGSTIGGCVPMLWHASMFSMSSILLSTVGGIAGIWAAWRLGR